MPKIILLNSKTGKTEEFEPVDAREILSAENSIYKADAKSAKLIGVPLDPAQATEINIPQMQGDDAEMQTGNSVDKYRRAAVVKASPGSATADRPMSTSGKPLAKSSEEPEDFDPETATKAELAAELDKRGVEHRSGATKDELKELFAG